MTTYNLETEHLMTITIEDLLNNSEDDKIRKITQVLEKLERLFSSLAAGDDKEADVIRMGTVLGLSLIEKARKGKMPGTFTKEDWKEIANTISDRTVMAEGSVYSQFVFESYAKYIDHSADCIKVIAGEQETEVIKALAKELKVKAEALKDGEITETKYIEESMWVSLEAIIKLLSAVIFVSGKHGWGEFASAAVALTFEIGRFRLYSAEQAILDEYIRNQYQLDEDLQEKLESFKAALMAETDRFNTLIENAFEPGFRDSLRASADLALAYDVRAEEILDSTEKIDAFFLD